MFRILDRYVFKETAQAWVVVTGVLLFILLSNQFARVLGDAAKDKIPKDAVFSVIGLTALQYLTILVPFGLFLAIMMAMGRLYRDSEMPAMMACSVSPGSLYRPIGWLALPLALVVAWLSLVVGPTALQKIEVISAEAKRQLDLASIEPGRFINSGADGSVIYAEDVAADGSLSNVFVQRHGDDGLEVVLAERGRQQRSDNPDQRFIILENGRRYEGIPGSTDFRIIEFREHGLPYALPSRGSIELEPEAMSTATLLAASDPKLRAELQWRLSVPIAILTLAFLAVPLSRSQPRQGRYGKLAIGVLIYIIYFNLLGAAKAWVEQDRIATAIGMWWVHALVVALALVLFGIQYGFFVRIFSRRAQ